MELGPAYRAQAEEGGPGKGLVAKALTQWPDSWSLSAPLQAILLFSAREGGIGHTPQNASPGPLGFPCDQSLFTLSSAVLTIL